MLSSAAEHWVSRRKTASTYKKTDTESGVLSIGEGKQQECGINTISTAIGFLQERDTSKHRSSVNRASFCGKGKKCTKWIEIKLFVSDQERHS